MLAVISLLSLVLVSFEAQASSHTFVVGSESTFVNVITRESLRNGRRVGRVRLDLREIAASCRALDAGFEGIVKVSPQRGVRGQQVSVDCLRRPDTPSVAVSDSPPEVTEIGS